MNSISFIRAIITCIFLLLSQFLYGMQIDKLTTFDTKIQKNRNNLEKLEKYSKQLKQLKEFSPDIQNLFNEVNNRALYLKTKKELDHLEQLSAGSLENINNLNNVQKKFKKIISMQPQVLNQDEMKQISTVFLPYIQQLINTQEFFLSKEAKDLKLFLPFTKNFQKNFKSFNSLIRNVKGDTILQHALRLKLPCESIRYLLSCGQSINDINNNKENALHIATSINNTAILELLLSYQDEIKQFFPITDTSLTTSAQVNAQDIVGQTPLHKTCIHNSIDYTKILLDYNASPAIKDNNNKQPIDYLFEQPWTYASALICQIFADYYESNELSQDDFYRDILQEIKNIPTENLKNIIPELKNKIESYNKIKAITIFKAIHDNKLTSEIIKRKQSTINKMDKMGKTPLGWCLLTKPEYCKLLLEHNADPNQKSKIIIHEKKLTFMLTPLEHIPHAILSSKSSNAYQLIELLMQYGADPNLGNIFPPLHYMAYLNNTTGVNLILNNKADINMIDYFGQTALHVACQNNCGKSAVELLFLKANPNIVSTINNNTALDYCYQEKHDTLILLLISFGANKAKEKIFINDSNIADMSNVAEIIRFCGISTQVSYDKNGKKGIYLDLPKD